jgi:hypothetical protein
MLNSNYFPVEFKIITNMGESYHRNTCMTLNDLHEEKSNLWFESGKEVLSLKDKNITPMKKRFVSFVDIEEGLWA